MKKTFLTAALVVVLSGSAWAADAVGLPGVVLAEPVTQNYVGIVTGSSVGSDRHGSVGVTVGRELTPNVTVEGQYERAFGRKGTDATSDRVSGNVLVGQRFGAVTPYVLGGVGYEWRKGAEDRSVYSLGGGAKLHLTEELDLDTRYRHIDAFDNAKRGATDALTFGLNFKF